MPRLITCVQISPREARAVHAMGEGEQGRVLAAKKIGRAAMTVGVMV